MQKQAGEETVGLMGGWEDEEWIHKWINGCMIQRLDERTNGVSYYMRFK